MSHETLRSLLHARHRPGCHHQPLQDPHSPGGRGGVALRHRPGPDPAADRLVHGRRHHVREDDSNQGSL